MSEIKQALHERARRAPLTEAEVAARKQKLAELRSRCDAMLTVDDRSAEEIIGYNDLGHFD
jgi:hypothetical protein